MFTALGNLTEAAVVKAMIDTLNGVIAGDWKGALASVEEANRISREHSNERAVALCAAIAAWVYGNLGDYVKGRHAALEAMHSAYLISYHLGLRSAFIGLANIERLEGDYAAAVSTISAMMSYRLRHNTLASSRGNSLHVTSFRQIKRKLEPATFAEAWTAGPAKLVELLGQPDSDRESWPLAPVPKMDTLETPEQAGVETSLDSRDADTSSIFPEPLTEREKEVLAFLVQGMTDPQIAEVLVVSPRTIHAHLRNIYAKMGVNTRSAATRLAIEHNLI